MKIKNVIPEIILIMFLALIIWLLLLPILGYFHEIGHALIAMLFGVRVREITPARVVLEPIENPLVLTIVRMAGGFFQALLPMLFFICVDLISRKYLFSMKKHRLMVSITVSLELALLTHSFYGIINGVVEGFLPEFYASNYNNWVFWGSVFLLIAILVSIWLYKRWRVAYTLVRI